MIDGLPQDSPGRYSVGSWGGLLLAILVGLACATGLLWLLCYAADVGTQQ